MSIEIDVRSDFSGLERFTRNMADAVVVGVQEGMVLTRDIAREEVILMDAYDTYALQESIYMAWITGSTYEEACADAADAALNNPTKWPDIREAKLLGIVGGGPGGSGGGLIGGGEDLVTFDPEVHSDSKFDAWVAVAASHGKYVENGYISWYGNWVPARPFWQATIQRATPLVIALLRNAILDAGNGAPSAPMP